MLFQKIFFHLGKFIFDAGHIALAFKYTWKMKQTRGLEVSGLEWHVGVWTVKHSCIVAVMHCTVMSVYLWTNDFSDWYVILYYVPKCAYFIMTIDWISSMCPLYIFFYETVKSFIMIFLVDPFQWLRVSKIQTNRRFNWGTLFREM